MAEWFLIKLTTCGVAVIMCLVIVGMFVYLKEKYHAYAYLLGRRYKVGGLVNKEIKINTSELWAAALKRPTLAELSFEHTPAPPFQGRYQPARPQPTVKPIFKEVTLYDKYGGLQTGKARIAVNSADAMLYKQRLLSVGNSTFYVYKQDLRKWCHIEINPGYLC